ncbi:putative annexin [Medicago truncatula]|uniref:Annexin D8 n=1 Tax=Medicago truncatula TaxID=3880 RepID=G7LF83_MEDTR|nr:annexin D4 [Medicago truncatula]AET02251.1 annexin D8 [Medicago truncatula]KEH19108.1 annexin D8 [Medicago truncatula]RHN40237.1 putative annexin [Medicago truncatula]
MAFNQELEAITQAFSGHGVDEKSLIAVLGKWDPLERETYRKKTSHFFIEDHERQFQRWNDHCVRLLKHEFVRFKNAVVLWSMHPWERDARLAKEALKKGSISYGVLIEIACTRSSEELLGARKAYHSLFDHSIEEDVASHIHGNDRKLLVALVSAYRYEGTKVKDDTAKSEAKTLSNAIKNAQNKPIVEDDEVIRILATRSKLHLQAVYKHYKEISGKNLEEDLNDLRFKETVQCLCTPQVYFSKVLDAALKNDVNKNIKKSLTRVIVTRADIDMKEIKAEYNNLYGVSLPQKIEETAKGNYKDFLLTLIARGG